MEIIPALSLTGRAAQAAVVAVLLAALFLMARPPAGAGAMWRGRCRWRLWP